jgi:predicted metal-dependent peptidase
VIRRNSSEAARLTKARTALLLDHPFFGSLLFRLKIECHAGVATTATDGTTIFYNPAFVDRLSTAELVGVLAHEVMHPALQHHTRRGDREAHRWNMAADYAINPLLLNAGLTLPADALQDDRFRNMSAERIYNLLADEESSGIHQGVGNSTAQDRDGSIDAFGDSQPGVPSTPGGFGQVIDAMDPDHPGHRATPDQIREQEREWQIAVRQAETSARLAGKCPAGLERAIEEAEKACVNWREALRRAYSETIACDYTWARPNRRFLASGLYLPGIRKHGVGEIAVGVDCSGSIDDRILGLFSEEISALTEETNPERVHVLYFDATVQRVEQFECGEAVWLNPVGGGGTDFRPVFAYLEEQAITPQSLIFLTDLCGQFPEEAPAYPVNWATTTTVQAPFGETIPMSAA